jgi:hypothetical protein
MGPSLESVFKQFSPDEPLDAADERYVDCLRERGMEHLFEQLKLPLASERPRTLFFSGVLGDGKTTILKRLQVDLEKEGDFVAFGEADHLFDLADVQYENILLAVMTVVDQTLRDWYQSEVKEGSFRQLWDELNRIAQLPIELSGDDAPSTGPFGKLSAKLKDSPDIRLQVRQRLRQAQSPTFLQVVNEYLERARAVIGQRGHRRLVVVLDNLDRQSELPGSGSVAPDEVLFIRQSAQLTGLSCHVIYTARLWLVDEHSLLLADRYGESPVVVPMIPVRRPDGTPHEAGLERLREVIKLRIAAAGGDIPDVFSDEASVERICRMSGGWLRGLMTMVRSCCSVAQGRRHRDPAGPPAITPEDVEQALGTLSAQARLVAANYREPLSQVARSRSLFGLDQRM